MAANETAVEDDTGTTAGELTVAIDVDDESFEQSLLDHVAGEVIDPMDGIDLDPEEATLETVVRQESGGYRLSFVVGGEE